MTAGGPTQVVINDRNGFFGGSPAGNTYTISDAAGTTLVQKSDLVVVAAGFGISIMRSWTSMDPLTSATEAELAGPVHDLLTALLTPR